MSNASQSSLPWKTQAYLYLLFAILSSFVGLIILGSLIFIRAYVPWLAHLLGF
jgi:Na+-transporting NADH:ubiquinone oxidoreductase subunit NqrD